MKKPRSGSVLVFVVALAAMAALVIASHVVRFRLATQQREAVERIRALGGVVVYEYMLDEQNRPRTKADPFLSTWVCRALGEDYFYGVKGVVLVSDIATDEDIKRMESLSRLTFLVVCANSVTDTGAMHIGKITTLRYLVVSGHRITPDCITLLRAQLPHCVLDSDY